MTIILFLLALVLAIPTFGLSLLAWFGWVFFRTKTKVDQVDRMRVTHKAMSPLFRERYAEFFRALDVPMLHGQTINDAMAGQCGRHIVNYIAHNPDETVEFSKGLQRWATKGASGYADPVEAAQMEKDYGHKAEIHQVAYRGIEALLANNNMPSFRGVDILEISSRARISQ